MFTVYNHIPLLSYKNVLHLENDWIFNFKDLDEKIYESKTILALNPHIIYHRHSRADQPDINKRLNCNMVDNHYKWYITDQEFSFNPFLSRTRDMRYISNFVMNHHSQLHPHCEMAYEIAAKYLMNCRDIFSFTLNGIVEHKGTPEFAAQHKK
jgi:hypothetical protein